MRLGTLLPLAALLLGTAACAGNRHAAEPAIPGCWYFDQDATEGLRLPWGVRLTDAPLEGWPALETREGVRLAATLTPEGDRDHPFGYWAPLPADSIEVGYPGGGGLGLRLAVSPDALTGTVRSFGDAVPPEGLERPVRPVRLTLARCPDATE